MIRALLILLAMTVGAQAECRRQTDMSPWGECGKPWPKVAQVALQPKWDARAAQGTAADRARAKQSQDASFVDPYFHGYHNTRPCLTTGQPEDCHGYVVGPHGAVIPGR